MREVGEEKVANGEGESKGEGEDKGWTGRDGKTNEWREGGREGGGTAGGTAGGTDREEAKGGQGGG